MPSTKPTKNTPPVVVAELPNQGSHHSHPYSCISPSPDGRYAVLAAKDTLRFVEITSDGLKEIRSPYRISQCFQATRSIGLTGLNNDQSAVHQASTQNAPPSASITISITDVVWGGGGSSYSSSHLPRIQDSNNSGNGKNRSSSWGQNYAENEASVSISGGHNSFGSHMVQDSTNGGVQLGDHNIGGGSSSFQTYDDSASVGGGGFITGSYGNHHLSPSQDSVYDSKPLAVSDNQNNYNGGVGGEALIAAAGSNGVVIIWRVQDLLGSMGNTTNNPVPHHTNTNTGGFHNHQDSGFFPHNNYYNILSAPDPTSSTPSAAVPSPEAVIVEHSRAVNKLAWHPSRSGLLLTASQDGSIKLWRRQRRQKSEISGGITSSTMAQQQQQQQQNNQNPRSNNMFTSWFSNYVSTNHPHHPKNNEPEETLHSWSYNAQFRSNCGAALDMKWSFYHEDIFAIVTKDGFLLAYNTRLISPIIRIAAHAGNATTIDWHPIQPDIVATGGIDRTVKVWDLENGLSTGRSEDMEAARMMDTPSSHHRPTRSSSNESVQSESPLSTEVLRTERQLSLDHSYHGGMSHSFATNTNATMGMKRSFSSFPLKTVAKKKVASKAMHVISVSAQVQCLKWRPPKTSNEEFYGNASGDDFLDEENDHHNAMLAIASISGPAAGGCGSLSLWSYHRPFMPLSIIKGHTDGVVSDFMWLDIPEDIGSHEPELHTESLSYSSHILSLDSNHSTATRKYHDGDGLTGTWQNVLSVGRDGKCLLQSFARGERPISNVPPSTFAMANLSSSQKGYGSLQIVSAHQNVPSGHNNDYLLTGLRRDEVTALAPGVFKEEPPSESEFVDSKFEWKPKPGGQKEPGHPMKISFCATDSGDLNTLLSKSSQRVSEIAIAPEVVHLSRFAKSYKLRRDKSFPTKSSLCEYNASIAEQLECLGHVKMWKMLATLLAGCGVDDFIDSSSKKIHRKSVMSSILLPTVKSLLLERADAGDIQTCVAICEVMEVIPRRNYSSQQPHLVSLKTTLPGLNLILVREWYMSYIESLQHLCLFNHASDLIRHCQDPEISKLSQESTTIHEACPTCWKPLPHNGNEPQRSCKSCRQRVGLCFLCHEPVKGMFVWCPGCGHGGCLEHAREWFVDKKQEMCPTGCGHKCNFVQHSGVFPRTCTIINTDETDLDLQTLVIS